VVVVEKEEEEEEQVEEEGATSRCPRAAEGAQSSAGTKVGSPSITTQTVLLRRGLSVAALAPGTTALPWLEWGVLAWLDGGLSGLGSLCVFFKDYRHFIKEAISAKAMCRDQTQRQLQQDHYKNLALRAQHLCQSRQPGYDPQLR